MSRELGFAGSAGYRGGYHRRALFVARVVLHDKHGTYSALLRADYGAEIGIINVASANLGHAVLYLQDSTLLLLLLYAMLTETVLPIPIGFIYEY